MRVSRVEQWPISSMTPIGSEKDTRWQHRRKLQTGSYKPRALKGRAAKGPRQKHYIDHEQWQPRASWIEIDIQRKYSGREGRRRLPNERQKQAYATIVQLQGVAVTLRYKKWSSERTVTETTDRRWRRVCSYYMFKPHCKYVYRLACCKLTVYCIRVLSYRDCVCLTVNWAECSAGKSIHNGNSHTVCYVQC